LRKFCGGSAAAGSTTVRIARAAKSSVRIEALPSPRAARGHERHDRFVQRLFCKRADLLERDAPVGTDDEGLRYPVHAPVDGDAAIAIGAGPRVRIAEGIEPAGGILGLVLIVDAVYRHLLVPSELQQEWVLLPAGDAPRGEDIDQRDLAVEITTRQSERSARDRRQTEGRNKSADQRRWELARVAADAPGKHRGEPTESDRRNGVEQATPGDDCGRGTVPRVRSIDFGDLRHGNDLSQL
jgi:hypothetical protein